jgi:hypothetical protein
VGFLNLFVVMETGKELNYPKGGKGGIGAGIGEADSEDRWFHLYF